MLGVRSERELTGPFWAAVEAGTLVRPVCGACGQSFFSPQAVCPHCQFSTWSYEPSSGLGEVYSHTTIHRSPAPEFEPPYVVADIEVEEGWRLFSWIVNCDPEEVYIGMPVGVCFVHGADGQLLPGFQPVEGLQS